MAKRGPKGVNISVTEFEKLCGLQCTQMEIAGWFACSEDTIENWVKRTYGKRFRDVYKEKRGRGLISLRRMQWRLAEKSPAMAIFLGKNLLGQADRPQVVIQNAATTWGSIFKESEADGGADVQCDAP